MITFHNSSNIIVTKRSNNQSQGKKSYIERKESTLNGQHKNRSNKTNFHNRNTLTSPGLKKTKKLQKKFVNANSNKKSLSNITVKNLKNGLLPNKENKENHKKNNYSTKSKQNTNSNIFNDNLKIKNRNNQNINNRNNEIYINNPSYKLIQNYGKNISNILNHHVNNPSPEPISVKIYKNNNYFSNRNNNLLNSIDNNINKNEYENIQNLRNHLDNNKSDEYHIHKRINTNYINNNYYNKFVQNINNINSNEAIYSKNVIKESNKCDEKVKYILTALELESIIDKFSSNYICFNDLFLLRRQDLLEMNVPIGKRNRLLHFLEKYKNFAVNYDFDEIKNYLYKYKNIYKNNLFIDKDTNPNINTISNNITNIKNDDNDIDNNNDLNNSKNINLYIKDNLKSILQLENKSVYINKDELSKLLTNKSEISEKNKNFTIFSSISNSKRSYDDLNYKESIQDKSTVIKVIANPNPGNYSTITTNNIEDNETNNTNDNIIVSSNHFYQKCNNLLNEIDNFNTLYNQLKQKSQERNRKLCMLLNKKNNFEYIRDKIKSEKFEAEIPKENIKTNELYNTSNNHFIDYNFNELSSLKEENVRNLNNELKYMN